VDVFHVHIVAAERDSMVQYDAICCSVLQCVAVCCIVLLCVAVCCSVWQCVAVYVFSCSGLQCVLQCVAADVFHMHMVTAENDSMMQYVVVCCIVLQCVAVCCSVLQ